MGIPAVNALMESELFGVHRGVRQGCALSPWLFNVFIDRVTREAKGQCRSEVKLSSGDVGGIPLYG